MKEKIFIAWGGNQPLAKLVGAYLEKLDYSAIVGGGMVESLFIGNQVFDQINRCSQAILLVQKPSDDSNNLSDNLMFEWGYIIAKLPPQKVHVFLIDMSTKDLPSDLAGSWAKELSSAMGLDALADEITKNFHQNSIMIEAPDKMQILSRWKEVKAFLDKHNTNPQTSDRELSHLIMHSVLSAYYHDEMPLFKSKLNALSTQSEQFAQIIQLILACTEMYISTDTFAKPLSYDVFYECKMVFDEILRERNLSDNLSRWMNILAADKLSFCYILLCNDPEISAKDKEYNYRQAIEYAELAIELLNDNIQKSPIDKNYSQLNIGYNLRNEAIISLERGDIEAAKQFLEGSLRAREQFFRSYKQSFPADAFFISRISQEYYLALIEKVRFTEDETEKMLVKRTVQKYMKNWEDEYNKQYYLIKLLKNAFSELE